MDTEYEIDPQTDEALEEIIRSIVKREKFVNYTAVKKPLSLKGNGFLSVPYSIDIKGTTNEGDKELNIFIKNKTLNDQVPFMNFKEFFARERFVYAELAKVFTQLQDEAKVPAQERLIVLKGYDESNDDVIVLENAFFKGYKTRNRLELPPIQSVELSIKQIARLHGLGYVLKTKMPEFFEKEIFPKDFALEAKDSWEYFASNLARISVKNLPPESKKKVEAYMPTFLTKYYTSMNKRSHLDTLLHGDFRPPNILVKEKDGIVTDVVLIDYQVFNCGSPVNDLIFYLYLYSDKAFRSQHLSRLIDLYYNTLTDFLRYFNIDVNDVCPRADFDVALKEREFLGLMHALFFYTPFFAPEGDIPDITVDAKSYDYDLDADVQERFNDLVEHYIELGVL